MNNNNKGPKFLRFINPLVKVLRDAGGALPTSEVIDQVIENEQISEAELQETLKNGDSRVRNQIQWARMYLVHAELLKNETRGLWELTEKGYKIDLNNYQNVLTCNSHDLI